MCTKRQMNASVQILIFTVFFSCSDDSPKRTYQNNPPSSGFAPASNQPDVSPLVSSLANSDSANASKIPANQSSDPFANVDDPSLSECKINLGNVKLDEDGDYLGSKQPTKMLADFLKNQKCEKIRIMYNECLGPDEKYPEIVVYNSKQNKLLILSESTNSKELFTGVTRETINGLTEKGRRTWEVLKFTPGVNYDEGQTEQKQISGKGKRPVQSAWDGSVQCVKQYIKDDANDAASIKFLKWSDLAVIDGYWAIRCEYKGSNAFGGIVTEDHWFLINSDQVVGTKE